MNRKLGIIWSAFLGLVLTSTAVYSTPYVFTQINPGGLSGVGISSTVWSLNDNGQLVVDSSEIGSVIYQNGAYTPLPACMVCAKGDAVSALGINDSGTVVGQVTTAAGSTQGFLLQNGQYTLFSAFGSSYTEPRAISPTGVVSGICTCVNSATDQAGFTYDPGTGVFTLINPTGSIEAFAQGINTAGQVAGSTVASNGHENGFIYQNGNFSNFQVNGQPTEARGINDAGLVTGFVNYSTSSAIKVDSFVGSASSGYQLLSYPGAISTLSETINSSGQIAGNYIDANNNEFGFLATPVTLPSGTTGNGGFLFNFSVTANDLVYIDPALATGYQYEVGAGNPNFGSVVLPIGIGDNLYSLSLCDGTTLGNVAGGTTYSFGDAGTSCFDVTGISLTANLASSDGQAFPTGLTFVDSGTFTGTMTPLASTVAEPETLWLFLAGLLTMTLPGWRRWRRSGR